ncbi:hypothetical protein [Dipodfec virus UOA04_Rod_742]|nr:hypothetical protein [Dipodfec virus UOA04_Rod_742]
MSKKENTVTQLTIFDALESIGVINQPFKGQVSKILFKTYEVSFIALIKMFLKQEISLDVYLNSVKTLGINFRKDIENEKSS